MCKESLRDIATCSRRAVRNPWLSITSLACCICPSLIFCLRTTSKACLLMRFSELYLDQQRCDSPCSLMTSRSLLICSRPLSDVQLSNMCFLVSIRTRAPRIITTHLANVVECHDAPVLHCSTSQATLKRGCLDSSSRHST